MVVRFHQLLLLLLLFCSQSLSAQLNAVLIGDAINQGNNCYIITQDILNQSGGVWFNNPIDFDEDFTIYYQNNFGNKDSSGADGMALVFKPNSNPQIGNIGGGLGYQGITPSLVVEFDTYRNNSAQEGLLSDPIFDHIAIMRNGDPNHGNGSNNLVGPVPASSTSNNIEDGIPHNIKIVWSADTKILEVFFDCVQRLILNFDIKNGIFNGDDTVYFGFVGSTGGLSNLHQVCFNSISFVDNLQLEDEVICDGGMVTIDATIPSGSTYSWSPTNGVSNPNSASPMFSPTATTTYTVTIDDVCGESTSEEVTITVLPNVEPIFDAVAPICSGESLDPLPTISNNGITGSWAPEINNTATTVYTFTPNEGQCAETIDFEIVVNPLVEPLFDPVDAICEGEALAALPTISNNGITGAWSPALDNTQTTLYTFVPNPGQTCAIETTLEIVVNPFLTPTFDPVESICEGANLDALPTTSNNGYSGSWSPALDNTVTTTYTFTPNPGECAISTTLTIEVFPNVIPIFEAVDPICQDDELNALPLISENGISGTWLPELNNQETTLYTFTPLEGECAPTTTLEIEVIPSLVPQFDSIGPICPGDELMDLPTVSNDGIIGTWSPALNNLETAVYTFTPESNQGCAVETTLEIVVIDPVVAIFDPVDPICAGDDLEPLSETSINGVTGTWAPAINNMETTIYTFTPDPGQCTNVEVDLEIVVIPVSQLSLTTQLISEPFSNNQAVEATVSGGTGEYEYSLDGIVWQVSNVFDNISGCDELQMRAREISGCSNVAISNFRVFDFPKFFTPNGDAQNDFWNIKCLTDQANVRIEIFDRYGRQIQIISPQSPGWDGSYNGDLMPSNDFWFRVEYQDLEGNLKTLSSHFSLRR